MHSLDTVDPAALAAAVAERSPLNVAQVERLFGGAVTAANKAVVWRFLNMKAEQQASIWQMFLHCGPLLPEMQVEGVK